MSTRVGLFTGDNVMKLKGLYRLIFLAILLIPTLGAAQGTEFTYQGKLNDGAVAANANYDFEFRLYDAGGTQIGPTNSRSGVAVTAGIFSVNLNFGPEFPGADRFLEIAVRTAGGGAYTILSPRQKISSSPYSVKSLSAESSATATTADTATSAANFTGNLGGDVTGQQGSTTVARLRGRNVAATAPQGGQVLKYNGVTSQWEPNTDETGGGGENAILNQTNLQPASNFNISGVGKADAFDATEYRHLGSRILGQNNFNASLYVGTNTGTGTGSDNTLVGRNAGPALSTGGRNTSIGKGSGPQITTGSFNTFVGYDAGSFTGGGSGNTMIGASTGSGDLTGSNNTLIGYEASVGGTGVNYATAIGAGTLVTLSNSVVLGRDNDTVRIPGYLGLFTLASGGSQALCRNGSQVVSTCSSSLRYKTNLETFSPGLDLVKRLKPIMFDWKDGGMHDLGLGAEDVAAIEPLLVTYNKDGQVEGVKYDRIGVILVNAVKEQQTQIERQQKQIDQQQLVIDGLRRLACSKNKRANICKEK
jgi:hypothetical protein